jgi:hypothetical protein
MAPFGRLIDKVMTDMAVSDAYERSTEVLLFREEHTGQRRPWYVKDVAAGRVRIYEGGNQGEMVGGMSTYSMPVKMAAQMTRRPKPEHLAEVKAIDAQIRDLHTRRNVLLHDAWLAGTPVTIADMRRFDADSKAVLGDRR